MPLDSVCIAALAGELAAQLRDMRVDKVREPSRDTVVLMLRGKGNASRLVMSAGNLARVHITESNFENPEQPPMFCMLLRKHLTGAGIADISQPGRERAVIIEFNALDEMGEPVRKRLVIELISGAANIILVGPDERIIDSLRRVDPGLNQKRHVAPGLFYRLPPAQGKPGFFDLRPKEREKLWNGASPDAKADAWMLDSFSGLSPLIVRELCFRCFGETGPVIGALPEYQRENFPAMLDAFEDSVNAGEFVPTMLLEDGRPRDFSFMAITQYGGSLESREYPSFSELLEAYFTDRAKSDDMRIRAQNLLKAVKQLRERTARRLLNQRLDLEKTQSREEAKRRGDLIVANIYRIKKGDTELIAEDFYEEESPKVKIPLDAKKTPQQNAALAYREYERLKTAEKRLSELVSENETQLRYLESVLSELQLAESERDLADIRRELGASGLIKSKPGGKKEKARPRGPLRFVADSGAEILVGRSNVQNDGGPGRYMAPHEGHTREPCGHPDERR